MTKTLPTPKKAICCCADAMVKNELLCLFPDHRKSELLQHANSLLSYLKIKKSRILRKLLRKTETAAQTDVTSQNFMQMYY